VGRSRAPPRPRARWYRGSRGAAHRQSVSQIRRTKTQIFMRRGYGSCQRDSLPPATARVAGGSYARADSRATALPVVAHVGIWAVASVGCTVSRSETYGQMWSTRGQRRARGPRLTVRAPVWFGGRILWTGRAAANVEVDRAEKGARFRQRAPLRGRLGMPDHAGAAWSRAGSVEPLANIPMEPSRQLSCAIMSLRRAAHLERSASASRAGGRSQRSCS
jgi:hypothetical protein